MLLQRSTVILKETLPTAWFVPVKPIREYYGDTVAIYYEWMNFFLKWCTVPAAAGLIIRILNSYYFEDVSKSPLNALFSIGMAFWSILFIVNWKRH